MKTNQTGTETPSPLNGERAGVRGEKVAGRSSENVSWSKSSHPSPLIPLPVEGRGKLAATHALVVLALATAVAVGCGKTEVKPAGFTPKQMADGLFTVMSSDRAVYTKEVVNRLQNDEKVIKASEHWKDEKTLPLPAQMFRMGAETVAEKNPGFTYALLSLWPVNKQNAPKTDVENAGLQFVADSKGASNYYAEEVLGGKKYFTAVYADVAVSPACVKCHNNHDDSPRTDFALNDVMGGVVIRLPLD